MALMVDQPQSGFKHYCKICKKGFGCGRALGGHMRAHGIGDESCHLEDEDQASDWEYKLGSGNDPPKNKRMYALRTNPNRLKTCRVCENCGKEFLSWKSFLEHGKCSSEDADESLVSSPGSEYEDDGMEEDGMTRRNGCGNWSKRKRSFRTKVGDYNNPNCPSSEEEDLANCLMMLSNATVDPMLLMAEPEESCASASKEEERTRNTMNFISPSLACRTNYMDHHTATTAAKNNVNSKGLFECKACKKVFNSHQALGGHRASHKKVKGCFAARLDNHHHQGGGAYDDNDEDVITHEEFFPTKSNSTLQFDHGSNGPLVPPPGSKRKSKVHECSICHRVFTSGQALGGHKRCHWITTNSTDASSLPTFNQYHDHIDQIQRNVPKFIANNEPLDLTLDLNLPASATNRPGFKMSTEIFLQSWIGVDVKDKGNSENNRRQQNEDDTKKEICDKSMKINDNNDNKNNENNNNVDDEAESKVKLAKLSELKDISGNGSSSPWLQVGICSTANDVVAEP